MITQLVRGKTRQVFKKWWYILNNHRYPIRPLWVVLGFFWLIITFFVVSFSLGNDTLVIVKHVAIWTAVYLGVLYVPKLAVWMGKTLVYEISAKHSQKGRNRVSTIHIVKRRRQVMPLNPSPPPPASLEHTQPVRSK